MRFRFLKIFIVTLSISTLLVSWCSTYAFAVDPVSAGLALASAVDAYGMAYGIGSVYDVTNTNDVVTSFDGLWDEFSLYQSNNGDSYNYQDFYDNFDESPSIQAFSHSSGKFSGFYIDSESAKVFDKFWTWLLTGPAELVKVDNEIQWNIDPNTNQIAPVEVYSKEFLTLSGNTLSSAPVSYESSGGVFKYVLSADDVFFYKAVFNNGSSSAIYAISPYQSFTIVTTTYNTGDNTHTVSSYSYNGGQYGDYYASNIVSGYSGNWTGVTYTNNASRYGGPYYMFGDYDSNTTNTDTKGISVKPYDISNPSISLPDITNPDYQPTAKEIVTNVSWDETYDDTDEDENGQPIPFPPSAVTPVIDDMISSIIDDGFAITDDPQPDPDPNPSPNEVFLPFIPVGLPSFNFSFSGIWHYVREWVASLASWLTTLFSIWSALPYSMVVPVYATAVVVIVLGVYKRFFM